jgi:hypothetical protein
LYINLGNNSSNYDVNNNINRMDDNSEGIYLDEFNKLKTLFQHGDSDNNEGKLLIDVIY